MREANEPVKSILSDRMDRLALLLLAAITLAVYLRTLARDVLPGDPGEFQFAAWRLGLAHPTGYPLYLILGNLWQRMLALIGVSPAAALNSLSAVFAVLAVLAVYAVMRQAPVANIALRRTVAAFTALLLAANFTFWSQALVAEVYTLHALLLVALLLALQSAASSSGPEGSRAIAPRRLIAIALIMGLSLTHHAITLLAVPAVLLYLWHVGVQWRSLSWRTWVGVAAALLLPLLLYAYIPLRSGPQASPWLHQRLGDTTLSLYHNDWPSFINFITGRSISVGFYGVSQALRNIPQAAWLWKVHFGWPGLALIALGLFVMGRQRRPLLLLTVVFAFTQQAFNLFYAIGDIAVYYIPLYVVGALWAGYGAAGLVDGAWLAATAKRTAAPHRTAQSLATLIAMLLFLLPLSALAASSSRLDQSATHAARTQWEEILAASPAEDAILVSNDRDEIVPLFYFQYVEKHAPGLTGLHPLMAPDERFSDIGATIDTALRHGGAQPVYLIKAMPGLEVKYRLQPSTPPLVRVLGPVNSTPPHAVNQPLGGLTLSGYDWEPVADGVRVHLYWRVNERLDKGYTTTVQLLAADGQLLAQDDRPPGGLYYPTSLWKPGEQLVEDHLLALTGGLPAEGASLLVGMYAGLQLEHLAPPLRLDIPPQE